MAQMFHDRVVQRLVALLFANLNHAGDLVRLALANEVRDRHVDDQDFKGGHPTGLVDALEKILRNYALERFGQSGSNLVLLVGRENVNDTIDRLGGAGSVECSKNKVTGGGGGQGQLDRFEVAHFTDQKDIRIFAQGAAQGRGK